MNSSTSLIQLFYLLLLIASNKLNSPYLERSNYNKSLVESLLQNDIMTHLNPLLSDFAYGQLALNLTQAFNHEVKLYRGVYTVIMSEFEIKVQKDLPLNCRCSYFKTTGLLCSHLLSIALKHKEMIPKLHESLRKRWNKENNSQQHSDEILVDHCKQFLQNYEGKLFLYFHEKY